MVKQKTPGLNTSFTGSTSKGTRHKPARTNLLRIALPLIAAVMLGVLPAATPAQTGGSRAEGSAPNVSRAVSTTYNTVKVDGLDIFYREAGRRGAPTILLLHGFPTSSQMFGGLIPALADEFHLVAPDYPGFGNSSMPAADEFDYTFDRLADVIDKFTERLGLNRYSLYVQDYGAPVGFRLAVRHPERVQALVVQNGNAYEEGLRDFWAPLRAYWREPNEANAAALRRFLTLEATRWQYTHGTRDPRRINPDNWLIDQYLLDRPGNQEIQLRLFYDYSSNPPLYPQWHAYFRRHQPPTLVVWGKNDQIFPAEGAHPYRRDLRNVEVHLLDTGHFALEEDGGVIANHMRRFLRRHVANGRTARARD
jgi:pimeloyl-ACP methyl ester carboxylesterase